MSTALTTQGAPRQLSVEKAREILARCKRVDEAKDIKDKAVAVAVYLRERKAGAAARDDAFEVALRAERRMGELLAKVEKAGPKHSRGGGSKGSKRRPIPGAPPTLAELGLHKSESHRAQKLAALPEKDFEGRIEKARIKGKLTPSAVLSTTGSIDFDGDEWATPPGIVARARKVLGGAIELDPASTAKANATVKAKTFWNKVQDGLTKDWVAETVFLNPPYSAPLCQRFVEKLVHHHVAGEVERAVLLVNSQTDPAWFHLLMEAGALACFTRGRIGFVNPETGEESEGNRVGQVFFFLGCDGDAVVKEFSDLGTVVRRVR